MPHVQCARHGVRKHRNPTLTDSGRDGSAVVKMVIQRGTSGTHNRPGPTGCYEDIICYMNILVTDSVGGKSKRLINTLPITVSSVGSYTWPGPTATVYSGSSPIDFKQDTTIHSVFCWIHARTVHYTDLIR